MRATRRLALLVLIAACHNGSKLDNGDQASLEPSKDALTKTSENGPVKATIRVWPAKPSLGDSIYLRLDVDAPAGISVDAPFQEAGDQRLGRFKVVGFVQSRTRSSRALRPIASSSLFRRESRRAIDWIGSTAVLQPVHPAVRIHYTLAGIFVHPRAA